MIVSIKYEIACFFPYLFVYAEQPYQLNMEIVHFFVVVYIRDDRTKLLTSVRLVQASPKK